VAIYNPSVIPSISCLTPSYYLWNFVHVANNVSHTENLQSNGCQYISLLFKIQDRIQVTRVAMFCREWHSYAGLNDSSMLIQEFGFEYTLQLLLEMTIQHAMTSLQALLYPQPDVPLVPTAAALASYALTHFRSAFTF